MAGLYVDEGYRTGLGVSFYDRLRELEALEEALQTARLVIVYGPRNVGKSELVRYWARRRGGGGRSVLAVRGDLARAAGVAEALEALAGAGERLREAAARLLAAAAPEALGLLALARALLEASRRLLGGEQVLFIDEFHLLPRYQRGGMAEAARDLEALAHWLAKEGEDVGVRVIVTVSEGFAATSEALARLHGYQARYEPVEHMDRRHFDALYREYRSLRGCSAGLCTVYGAVGGAPGYLPALCPGRRAALELVEQSKTLLEEALAAVREALGEPPRRIVSLAYEALSRGPLSPLQEPRLHRVGRLLVLHNVAYPVYRGGVWYKPQLPLYLLLLREAAGRGLDSVLPIEAGEALRLAEEEGCAGAAATG